MKVLKSKGFTLAEMLIVMAVVVVLAAAALPKIGSTLEGARESNDLSAIANAYTEAYTKVAMAVADGTVTDGDLVATVSNVSLTQTTAGWDYIKTAKVGPIDLAADDTKYEPTSTVTKLKFTFTGSGLEDLALSKIETGS